LSKSEQELQEVATEKTQSPNSLEQFHPPQATNPDEYEPYIGKTRVEALKQAAKPVEGKGWTNVNSTLIGGGVAEILQGAIPLAQGLGVRAEWYSIRGNDAFYGVTKKFHNMLQGIDLPISLEEIFGAYLDTINQNVKNTFIVSDLVVVHDPQPAAMVMNGVIFGNVLWRCHIDTSAPNATVWRFLLPYINQCAGAIFTIPKFIGPGVQVPLYQIRPCIDPRAEKNKKYEDTEALTVLEPLFNRDNVDPERPIVAAISRYDIHKNQGSIIEAFKKLKSEKKYDPQPYLILLGNSASDDPEGAEMLERLKAEAGEDPDIRFWVNEENNDKVVGSLMHIAKAFVHVSTREGFGLVVSEALWQGTPVIRSNTGGITEQVIDDKTGLVVEPLDLDAIANAMARLLDNPEEAKRLGAQGREHVRDNFLLPELVKKYLELLSFYSGEETNPPKFRLDDLSYSEIMHSVRPRHAAFNHDSQAR